LTGGGGAAHDGPEKGPAPLTRGKKPRSADHLHSWALAEGR
jgi:hypothetical protein